LTRPMSGTTSGMSGKLGGGIPWLSSAFWFLLVPHREKAIDELDQLCPLIAFNTSNRAIEIGPVTGAVSETG